MKNILANLEFLPAVTTSCDWLDKVSEIIDSAQESIKIYWREGFWFGNFLKDEGKALIRAHERGVKIEIIAGPVWLSVLSYEQTDNNTLFGMLRNDLVELYCLETPEKTTRFMVIDENVACFFRHASNPADVAIQPIKMSLEQGDATELSALFEEKKQGLLRCQDPEKHLLVLEAFEYDHIRQLGLLGVSHQEIYRELEKWEERKREVAHGIAERVRKERDNSS